MRKGIFTLTLFLSSLIIFAQEAKLDSTFGTDGYVTTPIGAWDGPFNLGSIQTLLLQTDGKLLAAGTTFSSNDTFFTYALARYLPNGAIDSTFNDSGIVVFTAGHPGEYAYNSSALLQSDGKVVQAGNLFNSYTGFTDLALMRYTTSGQPDATFGIAGVATLPLINSAVAFCVTADSMGRILVGGYLNNPVNYSSQFVVGRFNSNGMVDSTFGTNGSVIWADSTGSYFANQINSIAVQPGGKIIAGGNFHDEYNGGGYMVIYRCSDSGVPDNTFGVSGRITSEEHYENTLTELLPSGNNTFLALLATDTSSVLYRFTNNGVIDPTFGTNGSTTINEMEGVIIPYFEQLIVAADNSFYLGGTLYGPESNFFALARCYSNGMLDTIFAGHNPYTGSESAIIFSGVGNFSTGLSLVQEANSDIIQAGNVSLEFAGGFVLARFITGLTLGVNDLQAGAHSVFVYPNPVNGPVTLQYDLTAGQQVSIQLLDMQGQLVSTLLNNAYRNAGTNKEQIQLPANAAAGQYLLKITTGTGQAVIQIVKGQ